LAGVIEGVCFFDFFEKIKFFCLILRGGNYILFLLQWLQDEESLFRNSEPMQSTGRDKGQTGWFPADGNDLRCFIYRQLLL